MFKYSTQATGWMQPRACHSAPTPQGAEKILLFSVCFCNGAAVDLWQAHHYLFWSFLLACAAVRR
jgi:hypothetical protein